MRVFLSFVSRDSDAAERIIHHLKVAGFDVASGHTEISPGTHWPSEVLRAIRSNDAVVVLLSAASLASASASFEISAAVASQEKIIIPVVLEKGLELPFFLRDIHHVDLSNPRDWQEGMDSLVRALKHPKGGAERLDEGVREALAQEQRSLALERVVQEVMSETREAVLRKSLATYATVLSLLTIFLSGFILSGGGPFPRLLIGLAAGVVSGAAAWYALRAMQSRSHQDQRSRDE